MFVSDNVKKFLINVGISYINSFLAFITFLLLARLLGAEEYSVVAVAIAVGGFLAPIFNLGSSKIFVRDAVKVNKISAVVLLAQLSINMRLTVGMSIVIVLLFSAIYIYFPNIELALSLVFLSYWVGLIGLYPTSFFDYSHKTILQNFSVMIERLLVVSLVISLFLFDIKSMELMYISFALLLVRIGSIFSQLLIWWNLNTGSGFGFKIKFPNFSTPGVSLIFTISMLSNALLIYGNQLILATTNDPVGLSSYSFSFQLISLAFLFQSQAIRMLNRRISEICRDNLSNVQNTILIHSGYLIILSSIASLTIYYVSQFLPNLLNDNRYNRINEFMPYLCLWVIILGFGQVVTQYLLEFKQEKFHLSISILSGVSAFILGIIFMPLYGAISIVIILLIIHSLSIILYFVRLLYVINKRQDLESVIELT